MARRPVGAAGGVVAERPHRPDARRHGEQHPPHLGVAGDRHRPAAVRRAALAALGGIGGSLLQGALGDAEYAEFMELAAEEGFDPEQVAGDLAVAGHGPLPVLAVIGAAVIAVIAALSVLGSRLTRQPPPPLDWFATVTFALVIVAFLWPADFYNHYSAFLAPFLALAIALPASRVLGALPGSGARERVTLLVRRCVAGVAAAVLVLFAVLQGIAESHLAAAVTGAEISAARRAIPPGSCVLTDQVSYTIAINRFVSDAPGCPQMVDGVGSDYALSSGHNGLTGAGSTPAVEQLWLSAFRSAQYVWLTSDSTRRVPWTLRLRAYFLANFEPLTEGPDWLYARKAQHRR